MVEGALLLDGCSIFNRVRLNEWQQDERSDRQLWIGQGVGIGVNSNWRSSAANSTLNLNRDEEAELRDHIEAMNQVNKTGKWWKQWKGHIAAILGLVTTTAKIAVGLKVAAGGAFVDFNCAAFSLKAGMAGLKATSVMTVAGPAVLLGVGVAAAVYFIPWDDFVSWVESLFSRLCRWIVGVWEAFQTWFNQWWNQKQNDRAARPPNMGSRPMRVD